MKMTHWARCASIAVTFAIPFAAQVRGQAASSEVTVGAITKPSVQTKMGLNQFGTVLELPVKEGDRVKQGQVLLQQDDRQERALLEALQLEANSNVRVEAAIADLRIKEAQYKRFLEMAKTGAANPTEVEEAEVKVVYADAQVKIAKLELEKNKQEAKRQGFKVDQMTLRSTINGIVETIDAKVGEVTDPQKPLMTVVQNDPLWIEFFLPTAQSAKLQDQQNLDVHYTTDQNWTPAKVIMMAPVADAASDTQKIRLEMKNTDGRKTGLQVIVRLPGDVVIPASPAPSAALPGSPAAAVRP
jgi:RND family efflux transporter MFP subunit